ncbi:hypothetical protein ATCC90586_004880 [Pythium insidiosum]|nr:hypothetical protein ATCC90586_004880 [Pythium insidiosum]
MVHLHKLIWAGLAGLALLQAPHVSAHPESHEAQHSARHLADVAQFKLHASRQLEACASHRHARELHEHTTARRLEMLERLRSERATRRLAAADVLARSHLSNLTGITPTVDPATLFAPKPACVLEPEVTEGPYYVRGELVRSDIREKQTGIDLFVDLQFIDVNTCQPVPQLYVDFWHCNSTGVYSGVVASGNGDSSDLSNIDTTFARGLSPTDDNGFVQFTTKFPGHYTGRVTHIHLIGNHGGTLLPNNTYAGASVSNVGQIFFDQDLISAVEKTAPYTANRQRLTTNAQDFILRQEAATNFDPVMQYVYLGDRLEDGIFAWISIGVDMKVAKSVSAASTLTASGGVSNDGDDRFPRNARNAPPRNDASAPSSGAGAHVSVFAMPLFCMWVLQALL